MLLSAPTAFSQTGGAGYASRGLTPRCLAHIFRQVDKRRSAGESVTVRVSYLEVRGEIMMMMVVVVLLLLVVAVAWCWWW